MSAGANARHLPRWLDEYQRDPQRADLIALVQAIRRSSASTEPDAEATPEDELIALRVNPRLASSAGRELAITLPAPAPAPTPRPGGPTPEHSAGTKARPGQRSPKAPVTISLALPDVPGLVGPTTPLPLPMAERAVGPSASAERLRQLLDPFHHRLLTHLIGGVSSLRAPMPTADANAWESRLLNAAGLGSPTSALAPEHRRELLELLLSACGPASADLLDKALTIVLRDVTDADLRVRTQTLAHTSSARPESTYSRLGTRSARLQSATPTGTAARSTGSPLILGRRLRTRHGLRIKLENLTPETVKLFTPGATAHDRIAELLRLLAPPGITWDLELHLREPGRLCARLGAAQLGSTWLKGNNRPAPLRIVGTPSEPSV